MKSMCKHFIHVFKQHFRKTMNIFNQRFSHAQMLIHKTLEIHMTNNNYAKLNVDDFRKI